MVECVTRSRVQLMAKNEEELRRDRGRRPDDALPVLEKTTGRLHCGNPYCRKHGGNLIYESCLDPVSGFLASGYSHIPMLEQVNDKPHALRPTHSHSIRIDCFSAPPDTRRISENDPYGPYCWNSRRLLDARIRANLRNYTHGLSAKDTFIQDQVDFSPARQEQSQDTLAKRYMYKSSTQSAYEQVPWDSTLHPRKWKPISTLENASSRSLFQVRRPTKQLEGSSCSVQHSQQHQD